MYKLFSISFFVFFFSAVSTLAEKINKIQIFGNDRVARETILIYGDIEKDTEYEITKINDLTKKLYATGFFSNISRALI